MAMITGGVTFLWNVILNFLLELYFQFGSGEGLEPSVGFYSYPVLHKMILLVLSV